MAKGVIEKTSVASKTNEAINRAGAYTAETENGMVFQGGVRNAEGVWDVIDPATGALTNLWMVYNTGKIVVTDANGGEYSGLNQDPSIYSIPIGSTFSMFKPQIGDIITMSTDALSSYNGTDAFVVAVDANNKLAGAAAAVTGLSLEKIEDVKINIPSDGFGVPDGIAAYKFVVVAN